MDESERAHLHAYRSHLDRLAHRGRHLRDRLAADPFATEGMRAWQQDCAALVNRLSGGSKAHWLARAYGQAFLLRSPDGGVIEEAKPGEIVERILDVLEQAGASLSQMGDDDRQAPSPRRFEFVHNATLRPVLEQAYEDSRSALEEGRVGLAFITSCGVLEAVITDALEHAASGHNLSEGRIAGWTFETRIAEAERAGLIRRGCARLPPLALTYRDLTDAGGALDPDVAISERDARQAGQVLQVIMRDLDPGR